MSAGSPPTSGPQTHHAVERESAHTTGRARAPIPWLIGFAVLCGLLYALRGVVTPVLVALAFAYLLDPLVDRFEARGVPRSLGILVLLLVAFLSLVLGALLILPAVLADFASLARELPMALGRLVERIEPFLLARGITLPHSSSEMLAAADTHLGDLAPSALGPLRAIGSAIVGGTASALGTVAGLVIVPVLAYYLLKDFDHITARVDELLPRHNRDQLVALAREVDGVVGQFVRGQLTVMAILGFLYATGYALVGVPLAVPIGLIGGLLSFIPYVGSGVALGLGLLMVTLHFTSLTQPLLVLLIYGIVQGLEGFVITPRIVGDKLGISPPWVLIALMAGGELFGLPGVMLALPTAAVIKVFFGHALTRYRSSELFTGVAAASVAIVATPPARRLRRKRRPGMGRPRRGTSS